MWNRVGLNNLIPLDLACAEAVEKARKGNVIKNAKGTSSISSYYSYAHVDIGGKKSFRGIKLNWLKSPSSLANAGDVWKNKSIQVNTFDGRHFSRVNFVFFDGHVESLHQVTVKNSWNSNGASLSPWADSDGRTLSTINENGFDQSLSELSILPSSLLF